MEGMAEAEEEEIQGPEASAQAHEQRGLARMEAQTAASRRPFELTPAPDLAQVLAPLEAP